MMLVWLLVSFQRAQWDSFGIDGLLTFGMSQLNKAFKRGMVVGVKDVIFDKNKLCSACQAGKKFASPHPMKAYLSTSRCLELVHMDLFGPTIYKSLGGNLYCLVIVDDYSRYAWIFF